MKIYNSVTVNIDSGDIIDEDAYEYDGELCLCHTGGYNGPEDHDDVGNSQSRSGGGSVSDGPSVVDRIRNHPGNREVIRAGVIGGLTAARGGGFGAAAGAAGGAALSCIGCHIGDKGK